MDDEPAENISGGPAGGGRSAEFDRGDGTSRAEAFVDRLGELYWQKRYGGRRAFDCLVRTVLSQNTSDAASQPAHDALLARYAPDGPAESEPDLAVALAAADQEELAEIISPAGLHNQKSDTIVRLARRIVDDYGGDSVADADGRPADAFDAFVTGSDPATVREILLDMRGVGPKTADCVLLFSGGRSGIFPVDTHVHRIARRVGLAPPDADHETVRERLERDVPAEKCGFGHTAMIQFGREYCSARSPACLDGLDACPMADRCERAGVSPTSGTVVDPRESVDEN